MKNGATIMPNVVDSYIESQEANISFLCELSPYSNAWTIKVRCTYKGNMRYWNNGKSSGKFFSVDLLDQQGNEMKAIMYNQSADKYISVFVRDGVYLISKGNVRVAKKGYSHIKSPYNINLSIVKLNLLI